MTNGKRIFGAFTIGIALFFFWPVVIGGWQQVSAFRAAVAERQQLLDQRTTILANVQSSLQEYQQKVTQADGQKFTAIVPVHKDTAEVVSALQDIAAQSGVQLSGIRTADEKATAASQFQTLALTLELTGSYPSMRQFLTSLEQYARLVNVQSIEASTDSTSSQLRFVIHANVYFLK